MALVRRTPNLGKRDWAVGPICKRSGALLPDLKEKVSWDPLGLGFLVLPKVPLLHLRQGNA